MLSIWPALRPSPEIFRVAGWAWLVFNVEQLAFHPSHLGTFGVADQIGNVVALGGLLILSALLLVPARSSESSNAAAARPATPSVAAPQSA